MTLTEFSDILSEANLSYRYLSFGKTPVEEMPFITYFEIGTNNFSADSKVYLVVHQIQVDLWTVKKDVAKEEQLEAVFDEHCLFWNKSIEHDDNENCYRVTYELEV